MSDPMTNVAIEDVLSSIRRLVSEDARMRPVPLRADQPDAEEPVAADAAPVDSGRLVLTPALRVSADAPQADAAPFVLDQPMTADQAPEAPQDALEEAAMAWEDHHAEAADAPAATLPDSAMAEDAVLSDDDFLATQDLQFAPTDASADHAALQAEPADAWAAADDAAPHEADQAPDAAMQDAPMAAADLDSDPAPALSTSYLEDSDFVFASTRDGAPRATDAGQGTAADMTSPDMAQPAEDDLSADRDLLLREDEAILDEEMLRELVADIVRQELQGALGERITRNVRKLVRREIHRALTSQELE